MSFGNWGKEDDRPAKVDSEDNSNKEWYRVASNNRFWIDNRKEKKRADIIFLDCPELFNDGQNHVLAGMGLGQGPFSIWEHSVKIGSKWGNHFASGKNVLMSPLLRLLYLKIVGAWGKTGNYLEGHLSDLETLNKYYLDNTIDTDLYKEFIDPSYMLRVAEVIGIPTGDTLNHKVHTGGEKITTDDPIALLFSSSASKRTFRTIIDRTKYVARDGREYVDQLKLFATTGKQSAKWQSEFDTAGGGRRDKPVEGLGGHLYELTRNTGDKIPAVGDEKSYVEQVDLAKISSINEDATFTINEANVYARLSDDHHFNYHRMRATGFDDLSLEDMVQHVLTTFDAKTEEVVVPRPADYPLILLPKTPSYITSKYGQGDNLDPAEDDLPF